MKHAVNSPPDGDATTDLPPSSDGEGKGRHEDPNRLDDRHNDGTDDTGRSRDRRDPGDDGEDGDHERGRAEHAWDKVAPPHGNSNPEEDHGRGRKRKDASKVAVAQRAGRCNGRAITVLGCDWHCLQQRRFNQDD